MPGRTVLLALALAAITSCGSPEPPEDAPAVRVGREVETVDPRIWHIFQDSRGVYWFGSDGAGVFRFDGRKLVQFTSQDGLMGDRVREVAEHKSGAILIRSLQGVSRFESGRISPLKPVISEWPTTPQKLDPDHVWFRGVGSGPAYFDGKDLTSRKFPKHAQEAAYYEKYPGTASSPYEVYGVYRDKAGNVCFGTFALGAARYDGQTLDWLYEEHLSEVEGGGSFGIRSFAEDREGRLWVANTKYRFNIVPPKRARSGQGVVKYTRGPGITSMRSPLGRDHIYYLQALADRKGDLWMVTYEEGVFRFDGEKITHFPVEQGGRTLKTSSILEDRDGVLWVGTQEAGPFRLEGTKFVPFRPGPGQEGRGL